jgi:Domain of unknown function (DUF222)/HNH endonuclease
MTSTALPPPGTGPAEPVGPVAALAEASRLLDEAAETIWAARPGGELIETMEAVAALKAKLEALELAVVGELDAGPSGQAALADAGWASVKDYVTHTTGGRKGAGPAAVRLARQLENFPALGEELAVGRLSRVKAHIVAAAVERLPGDRLLRDKAVAFLLDEAQRLSADDLERAGRHVLEVVDPEGVDARLERELARAERAAHLNRNLELRFDRLGGGNGRLAGAMEDVLLLKTVLLSLAAPQPPEPGACGGDGVCTSAECRAGGHVGRDPRDHGARMFDALVQLARTAQATGALPQSHGGIPQVVVTISYEDLEEGLGQGTTTLGEEIDPATMRRLACDADLIPGVLDSDGRVLDVGRTQRLVTAAIWVALVLRDQHCAFPGCRRPPVMCHAHHIVHWADGGPTSLDNLVLLCGAHHRIIHGTPWEVRLGASGRPEFRPPDAESWVRDHGRRAPPGGRAPDR